MSEANKRKTLVVDGRMQARIVLEVSLPVFACLFLAVGGEMLYQRAVESGALRTDGTIFGFPEARLGMLLLFVSMATVQLVTALLASQNIAGVAFHIRRVLREYRDGQFGARVHLRRGDFQQELGNDVNEFLDWLGRGDRSSDQRPIAGSPHTVEPDVVRSSGTRPVRERSR